MLTQIVNPEKEILVVRHRILNNPNPNFEQEIESLSKLQEHTGQRKVVPVFEGDILETRWGKDVIMTHQTMISPSKRKFEALRKDGLAAYLNETIEKAAKYQELGFVVCLEPKRNITPQGIERAIVALQTHNLDRAYFDSFFGKKLDYVIETNKIIGTQYPTSYHVVSTFGSSYFAFAGMDNKPDVITVPSAMAFGRFSGPIIYGAVGSTKKLERLAQIPNVIGVYARIKEKRSLKMLLNSVRNRKTD